MLELVIPYIQKKGGYKRMMKFFGFDKNYQQLLIKFLNRVLEIKRTQNEDALESLGSLIENLDSTKKGQKLISEF